MPIDATDLRKAMARFAAGVTILTTKHGEEVRGMTANAIASVSLQPPLVLVCVDRQARTHELLMASGVFAICILKEEQQPLARLMASAEFEDSRQLRGIPYGVAVTGSPIITGALAYLDCRVVAQYPGGDHTIFLGEVLATGVGFGDPLLYYLGRYTKLETDDKPTRQAEKEEE